MSARDVAQSVLVSLSGSFQTAPNFWLNPANGVTYQIAVQSPQYRVTSLQDLMATSVNSSGQPNPELLSNLVQLAPVPERQWFRITTCSRSSTSTPAPRTAIWAAWRAT